MRAKPESEFSASSSLNAWALGKNSQIKLLLIRLQQQNGYGHVASMHEENNDHSAIMLFAKNQPGIRAYVFTHGQSAGRYGLHLEYPDFSENPFSGNMQVFENLSIHLALSALVVHFDVAC